MLVPDGVAPRSDADLLRWVCARAAANRSNSRCEQCQWFALHDLVPQGNHARLAAAECSPVPPRLAWFMCLTPASDEQALQHLQYVKAAIVSARLNAPSLAPYVVLVRARSDDCRPFLALQSLPSLPPLAWHPCNTRLPGFVESTACAPHPT